MRDDAAAAARRIVEEVLARHHGQGAEPTTATVPTAAPSHPTDDAVEAPAPDSPDARSDREEPDVDPGEGADAETELLAAAGDAASAAAQIARRIVAEALADADQAGAKAPGGDREEPQPGVAVRGVPAEGLSVADEQTVGIEVPDASTDPDRATEPPTGHDVAAPEAPPAPGTPREATPSGESPAPAAGSAEEIVRRIVADVQGEAPGPAEGPAAPQAAAPEPEPEPERDTTAMLEEQRPENGTAALPQHQSVAVGAPAEARSVAAPAPSAVPGRELEGWATPLRPDPSPATATADGAPRTLRWLLASLLGAVALAVLFPLAVAALRALVAMD